jgi:hypothetical protein
MARLLLAVRAQGRAESGEEQEAGVDEAEADLECGVADAATWVLQSAIQQCGATSVRLWTRQHLRSTVATCGGSFPLSPLFRPLGAAHACLLEVLRAAGEEDKGQVGEEVGEERGAGVSVPREDVGNMLLDLVLSVLRAVAGGDGDSDSDDGEQGEEGRNLGGEEEEEEREEEEKKRSTEGKGAGNTEMVRREGGVGVWRGGAFGSSKRALDAVWSAYGLGVAAAADLRGGRLFAGEQGVELRVGVGVER